MSPRAPQSMRLVLSNEEGLGKITVELEPFFEFSFWLAEELQDLIACQQRDYGLPRLQAVHGSTPQR